MNSDTWSDVTDLSAGEAWRQDSVERCRNALAEADASADRLVLLRTWARLNHGWLPLDGQQVYLRDDELPQLDRFGLALSTAGDAIRIKHEEAGLGPVDLDEPLRLDTSLRSVSAPASPDGVLLRHIGHRNYRTPAQKSAVRALLTAPSGAGLLVSMPTGSGKSLLFQLSTLTWRDDHPGACVIVITPTVALALDHVRTLSEIPGLEASRALTGDVVGPARDDLLGAFRRGEIPVLFLSPEFALGAARDAIVEAALPRVAKDPHLQAQLKAIFVDEAHIIESWGRGFRPDFQRLPALVDEARAAAPGLLTPLLSATLTPAAREELRRAYGAAGPWIEIDAHTPRYEFDIVVQAFGDASLRQEALDYILDRAPRPAIVYTTRVEDAADLHRRQVARGYRRVELFTGQVSAPEVRRRIIDDWSHDRLDLVVATSAFGLGIDKADVRSVIHACLPEGAARWYQEIGRASRDGRQGLAACLFTDERARPRNDVGEAAEQVAKTWLSRELVEKRWRALLEKPVRAYLAAGARRLVLDLDSVREGLSVARPTDYNRAWNMGLITLLQRSGDLQVVSVGSESDGEASFIWEVEIVNPALLDPSTATWERIFAVRDRERRQAQSELATFTAVMQRPTERCITAAAFELIEGEASAMAPTCGRCPACRRRGACAPPNLRTAGLEVAWPQGLVWPTPLPTGPILLQPHHPDFEKGLDTLLMRLASAGVEQYVTPDDLVAATAASLALTPCRLGLVLSFSEWRTADFAMASAPTALLLPRQAEDAERLVRQFRRRALEDGVKPYVLVAARDAVIGERRIDQQFSGAAPYAEHVLDLLVHAWRRS